MSYSEDKLCYSCRQRPCMVPGEGIYGGVCRECQQRVDIYIFEWAIERWPELKKELGLE